jgi:hypothetical protein
MDGDSATDIVEGSETRRKLDCCSLQWVVIASIAEDAANCRLGNTHTL